MQGQSLLMNLPEKGEMGQQEGYLGSLHLNVTKKDTVESSIKK